MKTKFISFGVLVGLLALPCIVVADPLPISSQQEAAHQALTSESSAIVEELNARSSRSAESSVRQSDDWADQINQVPEPAAYTVIVTGMVGLLGALWIQQRRMQRTSC